MWHSAAVSKALCIKPFKASIYWQRFWLNHWGTVTDYVLALATLGSAKQKGDHFYLCCVTQSGQGKYSCMSLVLLRYASPMEIQFYDRNLIYT